jgi:hypothetical protein
MIQTQFDLEYLKDLEKRLNEIQAAATTYGTYQSNSELLSIVDGLTRVAGMLADVKIQELELGYVQTSDPVGYIESKLPYERMLRYRDKTQQN